MRYWRIPEVELVPMTREQAEAILQRCRGRVDFATGKVFDHVILEGWFDADELQAVLALLRAETQQDEGERPPKL